MIILKNFTYNFELTLDNLAESNSHLIVVLGDFNTKSKNWHINDKATTERAKNLLLHNMGSVIEFLVLY